uniref:Uncharacterized protein LOC114337288 n=1 Tax=Diabrotica virgifera virgifera TaxID=50390 RepID=A0A6P7GEU5_DIAVI
MVDREVIDMDAIARMTEIAMQDIHLFAYQGFDPAKTRAAITKVAGFATEDVIEMVQLFFTRGTNLSYIKAKSSRKTQFLLDKLIKKYGLTTRVNGSVDKISLSRVAASFPEISLKFLLTVDIEKFHRPMPLQKVYNMINCTFPPVLSTNILLSVLPPTMSTSDKIKIFTIVVFYSALELPVLNPKLRCLSLNECMNQTTKYARASFKSKLFNENERKEICSKLLIFEEGNGEMNLTQSVESLYNAVMEYLKSEGVDINFNWVFWC